MPVTAHALVDYFNVAQLPRHRPASFRDHSDALEQLVAHLLHAVRVLQPRPASLEIRLYGGWHDEATDDLTEARQALGAIARRYYPAGPPIRVFVRLADSLMTLSYHDLSHTLRLWTGFPPFRIRRPTECGRPQDCPLDDLRHWQRNRCPRHTECPVRTRDAILSERQKLVDTAIVADTIHFARYYTSDWVAVVSNDDDIVPGLLAGATDHDQLVLLTIDRTNPSPYAQLLSLVSVHYSALGNTS